MDIFELRSPLLTRRDFIKIAGAAAVMLGLSRAMTPKMVKAIENTVGKPAVIWLEGQDCAGCVESFLNNLEPLATSILLDSISLRYNETAMAASGSLAEAGPATRRSPRAAISWSSRGLSPWRRTGFSAPSAGSRLRTSCGSALKTRRPSLTWAPAPPSAAYPAPALPTPSATSTAAPKLHHYYDDVGPKPVINLPTCPLHNERLVSVIIYYLTFGKVPDLDEFQRPTAFYKYNQHENCERRAHFEAGEYVTDFGNPKQQGWCLYLKGCKGPWAYQDCWKRLWNDRTNYCIRAGIPCVACSDPEFYESVSPLYVRRYDVELPGIGRVDLDKIMAAVGGAVAAGVGLDMAISRATGRWKNAKGERPSKRGTGRRAKG